MTSFHTHLAEFLNEGNQEKRLLQSDEDFAFLSGQIRSLESKLISYRTLEDLAKQQNLKRVDQVLNEADYPKAETIHLRLQAEKEQLTQFIKQTCPNIFIEEALFLQEFYHNAKAMLKYFLSPATKEQSISLENRDIPDFLKPLLYEREDNLKLWNLILQQAPKNGLENFFVYLEQLEDLSEEEQYRLFAFSRDTLPKSLMKTEVISPFVIQTIAYVKQYYTQAASLSFIDLFLDKAYAKHLKFLGVFSKDIFLQDFITYKLDLANQKTLARLKQFQISLEQAEQYYLPGGMMSFEDFKESFSSHHTAFPIEEKLYLDYLRLAKKCLYGSQIFIAYVYAKQIELQNIRILVSMLGQKKDFATITAKLRGAYFDE